MTSFDPRLQRPKMLFIEVTSECNLRCKHCHMWMNEDGPGLTVAEKQDLIRQFHALNPKGLLILTGGEPMTKEDEFFSLTTLCRSLGLISATTSNATLINEANLRRTLTEGVNCLTVSLDGPTASIHDFTRGTKGCFNHVTSTLKELTRLKREAYPDLETTINTNTVILDRNIDVLEAYIDYAKQELRVDGVMFQMLAHTYANRASRDRFFSKHFFSDAGAKAKAKATIDRIIARAERDDFIKTNLTDLQWMKLYIDDPEFLGEQVCGSHERNLIVDRSGAVQLCFNMMSDVTGGKAVGNVREASLAEIWMGHTSEHARSLMSVCRKNCGMAACHRKLSPEHAAIWS